jgi:site-specific DNA-methyltransferase (adenine-specific)
MLELNKVYNMDCMEGMREIPDNTVDLIVTDPPYFKVVDEPWDKEWEKPEHFLAWLDGIIMEFSRILKPNGSLYLFAYPSMAARIEVLISRRMEVLNHIVWAKPSGRFNQAEKESLRAYFPASERVIFAEHFGVEAYALGESEYKKKCDELRGFVFEPLRAYLEGERKRAGIDKADCNVACGFSHASGGMASRHYFSRSQWCLPTKAHYVALRKLFNGDSGTEYLRREYEDLRREYEDLRLQYEKMRRPFAIAGAMPFTDVWDYAPVPAYEGKHPCEKPRSMYEHIIQTSSRTGDIVLDAFAGSGVAAEACIINDRRYLLFEKSAKHYAEIVDRIYQFTRQTTLEGI